MFCKIGTGDMSEEGGGGEGRRKGGGRGGSEGGIRPGVGAWEGGKSTEHLRRLPLTSSKYVRLKDTEMLHEAARGKAPIRSKTL